MLTDNCKTLLMAGPWRRIGVLLYQRVVCYERAGAGHYHPFVVHNDTAQYDPTTFRWSTTVGTGDYYRELPNAIARWAKRNADQMAEVDDRPAEYATLQQIDQIEKDRRPRPELVAA
jgi:hypothetical protein